MHELEPTGKHTGFLDERARATSRVGNAYIVAVFDIDDPRFFHRTLALSPFFMLITLFLVVTPNMLGTTSAVGLVCLRNLGWLRVGSTCARYLSYWEKVRQRGLVLGLGGRLAPAHGFVGEEGTVVRAVSVVSLDPAEVFRAWLERGPVDSVPGACSIGVCGLIGMPSASALALMACSSSVSESAAVGCKTSDR